MNTVLKSLVKASILTVGLLAPLAGNAGTAYSIGDTVYINGTVDRDMYNQWKEVFTNGTTNVVLESPGGSVYWGRKIAEDIYNNRYRVHTEASGQCASMCAVIWLSADKHWYNSKGRVGFHFSYVNDADYLQDSLFMKGMEYVLVNQKYQTTNDFISDFKYIDNKEKFGEYMQGIVTKGLWPSSMWYPTNAELESFEGKFKYRP